MDKREHFAEVFRTEHPGLVRELTLILGDHSMAEDVAADSFVELWTCWTRVRDYERPGAWLRLVALRKASRARWRRDRRRTIEELVMPSVSSDVLDVDLVRALQQLSRPQRTAVVMHHLGGWPAADIATVLGCSDITVRTHLHRARRRLAQLLGEPTTPAEVGDVDRH